MFILDATTEIVKPAAAAVLSAAEFSEMTVADEAEYEAWLDSVEGMAHLEARAAEADFAARYESGELPW